MLKIIKIQTILNLKEFQPSSIKLDDLVGKSIVIYGITPKVSSKYSKNGFVLDIMCEQRKYTVFTCAKYLVEAISKMRLSLSELGGGEEVGIACTVKKQGSFFVFAEPTPKAVEPAPPEPKVDDLGRQEKVRIPAPKEEA